MYPWLSTCLLQGVNQNHSAKVTNSGPVLSVFLSVPPSLSLLTSTLLVFLPRRLDDAGGCLPLIPVCQRQFLTAFVAAVYPCRQRPPGVRVDAKQPCPVSSPVTATLGFLGASAKWTWARFTLLLSLAVCMEDCNGTTFQTSFPRSIHDFHKSRLGFQVCLARASGCP